MRAGTGIGMGAGTGAGMRIGIVGSGKIVQEALPVFRQQELSVSGIWSRTADSGKKEFFQEKYGISKWFPTYTDMLLSEDIDTIYLALPNSLHYEYAKKALEYGKHVICEKPFVSNALQLEQLSLLAKRQDCILLEAITNQYMASYQKIREIIHEEKLGRIRMIAADFSQYSSRYDDFCKGKLSPVFDPEYDGGALMDLNVYNIHFITGLFGSPSFVRYFANMERGVDTSGILIMGYPDFQCSCIAAKDAPGSPGVCIQGTKGTLTVTSAASICDHFQILYLDGRKEEYDFTDRFHRMEEEFAAFAEIIRRHDVEKARQAMEQSLRVMDVIDDARYELHNGN